MMIFDLMEMLRSEPLVLIIFTFGVAGVMGGIPPMIERSRRRNIENDLPAMLEALSDSLKAGLGLQQAMQAEAERNAGVLGSLLRATLEESHTSSFDSALANFASKTRSSQVQRVMHLLSTAIEQDSPLGDILANLAMDYERLNDLMNQREEELMGRAILIILFLCLGLPILIAFIVGLFAPESKGFQLDGFHSSFSLFFGACAGMAVAISGRMLGRLGSMLWFVPIWMATAMFIYLGGYQVAGS